jgi:hypothetical protein
MSLYTALRDLGSRSICLTPRGLLVLVVSFLLVVGLMVLGPLAWETAFSDEHAVFLKLTTTEEAGHHSLVEIRERWQPHDAILLLEALTFVEHRRVREAAFAWLEETTGQTFGSDHWKWYEWIWNTQPGPPPGYAAFKARLYGRRDPELAEYFRDNPPTTVRLDEVVSGGVRRDGIPPLRYPRMVPADEADYLEPDNLVFGVAINGDARAYPRRILIHHELITDVVGGEPITGAYCTLCNAMVVYRSTAAGQRHELGTSGFLYRSSKLMYDQATKSLWSTLSGEPVVGPLAGQGIALELVPVVTTSWHEWRCRHPQTHTIAAEAMSRRDSSFDPRDYREASSHVPYFATDQLLFGVPWIDARLRNKEEVFIPRIPGAEKTPVAIAQRFLVENPVHHLTVAGRAIVIVTDETGANRAYAAQDRTFTSQHSGAMVDQEGRPWQVREDGLVSSDGVILPRLPGHRGYWFGWYAARPNTLLVR